MSQKSILCPLPDCDFDVTEVAVPWKLLTEDGRYVSARWPGDAYAFTRAFLERL